MNDWLAGLILIVLGLAEGIAVGSGFVAFLVVLNLIPRLMQLTRAASKVRWFEGAVIAGALFGTCVDFYDWTFHFFPLALTVVGLFSGIFVGMLAAGLVEALNVFPILAKRLGMHDYIFLLLMALVLGKVCGSLFEWIYFAK